MPEETADSGTEGMHERQRNREAVKSMLSEYIKTAHISNYRSAILTNETSFPDKMVLVRTCMA